MAISVFYKYMCVQFQMVIGINREKEICLQTRDAYVVINDKEYILLSNAYYCWAQNLLVTFSFSWYTPTTEWEFEIFADQDVSHEANFFHFLGITPPEMGMRILQIWMLHTHQAEHL